MESEIMFWILAGYGTFQLFMLGMFFKLSTQTAVLQRTVDVLQKTVDVIANRFDVFIKNELDLLKQVIDK